MLAQTAHAENPDDATLLGTVHVYSATGRSQAIEDVQASVQVISARDLQAYPGTSVTEALKMAVGVDARSNGPTSSVTMRGLASSGTLILIDGERRTNKYGSQNLNMLATEDVERIEVVRGPMSALYGTDASGGVINVITRKPEIGSGLSGSVAALYGSSAHSQRTTDIERASVTYGGDVVAQRLGVEKRNRDAFRYVPSDYLANLAETDESYVNYAGTAKLAQGHTLNWRYEYVDQNDTKPDRTTTAPIRDFTGFEKETRNFLKLGYVGSVGAGVLNLDASRGTSDGKTTRAFPTIETTDYTQTQLAGRYALDVGSHALTLGLGQIKDELDVSLNSKKASRTDNYLLLQDEWKISNQWKVLAGLRRDSFNDFGTVTTPRASVLFQPTNELGFRIGYGEAYRAPSVLEQYSRFVRQRFLILGNPDLKPESNKSWEVAASYSDKRFRGEIVAYRSKVSDLITSNSTLPAQPGDPAGVTTRSIYYNVSKADIDGIEASATYQLNDFITLMGAYELIDARDGITGARLTGRAQSVGRGGVRFEQGKWSADLTAQYIRDYYSADLVSRLNNVNTNYGTTAFKANYRVTSALTASIGIDNMFDSKPPGNWSITEPAARFGYVSARYTF
jgi:outer membrane receptor for ferrienterochelin and colicins